MDESNNMGGGGNTTNQTNQGGDQKVFFASYNIGRKEKAQYFPGEEGKKKEAKGIAKLFEGKNKFITIAIIAVVVILLVILVLWLVLWRKDDSDNGLDVSDAVVVEVPEEHTTLSQIAANATQIYNDNAGLEDPYSYVLAYIESEATNPDNENIDPFSIRMIMSTVYIKNKDYQLDIDYLNSFNTEELEDEQVSRIYFDLYLAYTGIGDTEKAGYYLEQRNYYATEVISSGSEENKDE